MTTRKRRYGVIVMVVIQLSLAVSLAVAFYKVADNNNKICTAVEVLSSAPVTRPADPVAHPAREELWRNYINTVNLKRKLGCTS